MMNLTLENKQLETIISVRGFNIFELLKRWIDRQHQRRQLARLDARLLRDMGISHEQWLAEIRKPFWQ